MVKIKWMINGDHSMMFDHGEIISCEPFEVSLMSNDWINAQSFYPNGGHELTKYLTEIFQMTQFKKSLSMDKTKEINMKKQSKAAKMDESLGMRKGKESTKKQSMKDRRNESKGAAKGKC